MYLMDLNRKVERTKPKRIKKKTPNQWPMLAGAQTISINTFHRICVAGCDESKISTSLHWRPTRWPIFIVCMYLCIANNNKSFNYIALYTEKLVGHLVYAVVGYEISLSGVDDGHTVTPPPATSPAIIDNDWVPRLLQVVVNSEMNKLIMSWKITFDKWWCGRQHKLHECKWWWWDKLWPMQTWTCSTWFDCHYLNTREIPRLNDSKHQNLNHFHVCLWEQTSGIV